jgi:hypothetical protein
MAGEGTCAGRSGTVCQYRHSDGMFVAAIATWNASAGAVWGYDQASG